MVSSSDETDKKRCNVDVLIDARGFYSRIYGKHASILAIGQLRR